MLRVGMTGSPLGILRTPKMVLSIVQSRCSYDLAERFFRCGVTRPTLLSFVSSFLYDIARVCFVLFCFRLVCVLCLVFDTLRSPHPPYVNVI